MRFVVVAALAAFAAAPAVADEGKTAAPAERRCPGVGAVVHGGGRDDVAQVCAGAGDSIGFFAGLGFEMAVDLHIHIVETLPDKASPSAVGCYVPAARQAYVLAYAHVARHKEWFGVAVEPALYRSLAAHEVAHAVAACFFGDPRPSLAAVEYAGYVAMFSTMAPDLRRRVLDGNPGTGFETDAQINTLVYLIDPMRFGVESYRHYLRPEAGPRYLRALLAGEVLLE
jgi:hypothetical protein